MADLPNANPQGRISGPYRALQGVSWAISKIAVALAVGLAVALVPGCSGIAVQNIETAIADLEDANAHVQAAYQTLANDPALASAAGDLAAAWADVDAARHALLGRADESCDSRCEHECSGVEVASCILNCVHGHGCYPSCCGCKDGSTMCKDCGGNCDTTGCR